MLTAESIYNPHDDELHSDSHDEPGISDKMASLFCKGLKGLADPLQTLILNYVISIWFVSVWFPCLMLNLIVTRRIIRPTKGPKPGSQARLIPE
jgi:hypothetical protein